MRGFRAIIHGQVQGVGFRASAAMAARRLKLRGWVRNLPDGAVETLAVGAAAPLRDYLIWLHKGPSMARVLNVEVFRFDQPDPNYPIDDIDSFEIRYDAE